MRIFTVWRGEEDLNLVQHRFLELFSGILPLEGSFLIFLKVRFKNVQLIEGV